ncbi:MAG: hypothetical protein Q8O67_11100 [Deltaproteobacteria bacterium]|nr:hypothetical protein [Deltaproteobacteria bacterium]
MLEAIEPTLHLHGADMLYALSARIELSGRAEVQQMDIQIEERFVLHLGPACAAELFALVASVVGPPLPPDLVPQRRLGTAVRDELDGARVCLVNERGRLEALVHGRAPDPTRLDGGAEPLNDVKVRHAAAAVLLAVKDAISGRKPSRRGGPAMRFPHDEHDSSSR